MRLLKNLNIKECFTKRRLVFDESLYDKFETLAVYFYFLPFIILPIQSIFKDKFVNSNETFLLYSIYPISIFIGLYIIYRKATEKYLMKIEANLGRAALIKLINEYANYNQLEVFRKTNECIIINEFYSNRNHRNYKIYIFFSKDNLILFTILRNSIKINLPVLFTHFFLKHDLKKMIKNASK